MLLAPLAAALPAGAMVPTVPPAPMLSVAVVAATAPAPSAGTALVRTPNGGLWAFAVKANGQIFQTIRGTGEWTAPHDLGGPFKSGPAATYSATGNHIDLYAVGTDASLKTSVFDAGRWSPWVRISTAFSGGLSAVRLPSGELQVFGVGTDSHVYEVIRKNGRWLPRRDLGGTVRSSTAVTYYAPAKTFDLFAIGTDGRIHHRSWSGRWGGWSPVTSGTGFTGVAAMRVGAALKVYGVNGNRHLYEISRDSRWTSPMNLGGSLIGTPAAVAVPTEFRIVANRTDGTLAETTWRRTWSAWKLLPGSGFPRIVTQPPTRVQLAKTLLARWGGRLSGLPGVLSDLQTTAAGRAISNSASCNRSVYLDERMLTSVVAATSRYQVMVNNMVSGRACGSGYHPLGKAVDFNTVVDPATGRSTNWHSGASGDNQALDREYLTYVAAKITGGGGGAGQRDCAGSAGAELPPGMAFFADTCNHQHLDSRP